MSEMQLFEPLLCCLVKLYCRLLSVYDQETVIHCIYSGNKYTDRDWGCLTEKLLWHLCYLGFINENHKPVYKYFSRINC